MNEKNGTYNSGLAFEKSVNACPMITEATTLKRFHTCFANKEHEEVLTPFSGSVFKRKYEELSDLIGIDYAYHNNTNNSLYLVEAKSQEKEGSAWEKIFLFESQLVIWTSRLRLIKEYKHVYIYYYMLMNETLYNMIPSPYQEYMKDVEKKTNIRFFTRSLNIEDLGLMQYAK